MWSLVFSVSTQGAGRQRARLAFAPRHSRNTDHVLARTACGNATLVPRTQRSAQLFAERCAAELGSRLPCDRRKLGPGSAKHRFARATRCIAPGTRTLKTAAAPARP